MKGGSGNEMRTTTAPRSADQQPGLLQPLQLSASTGVRQAGQGCVITGCIAVMVGQPVTGNSCGNVHVWPGICQHAPPVKLLIISSAPRRRYGVPAQGPYVLVPYE